MTTSGRLFGGVLTWWFSLGISRFLKLPPRSDASRAEACSARLTSCFELLTTSQPILRATSIASFRSRSA